MKTFEQMAEDFSKDIMRDLGPATTDKERAWVKQALEKATQALLSPEKG